MMQENNKRAPLLLLYEKEVERESAKIADMKAKGSNLYDLKKKENVLGESRKMIPDCLKSLEAALSDKALWLKWSGQAKREVQRLMILGAPLQILSRYFNLRRIAGNTGVYSL